MDDRRLTELFSDAATLPQTRAFTVDDVRAASRRETARQRARLGVGALAAAGLVGVGVLGGALLTGDDEETAASAPVAGQAERADSPGGADAPPAAEAVPVPSAAVPEAAAVGECGPVDAELADALVAALEDRGTTPSGPAGPAEGECAAGTRAAAVPVGSGTVLVLLVPEGEAPPIANPGVTATRSVDGGGSLAVQSVAPRGESPPLATEVRDLARELAEEF